MGKGVSQTLIGDFIAWIDERCCLVPTFQPTSLKHVYKPSTSQASFWCSQLVPLFFETQATASSFQSVFRLAFSPCTLSAVWPTPAPASQQAPVPVLQKASAAADISPRATAVCCKSPVSQLQSLPEPMLQPASVCAPAELQLSIVSKLQHSVSALPPGCWPDAFRLLQPSSQSILSVLYIMLHVVPSSQHFLPCGFPCFPVFCFLFWTMFGFGLAFALYLFACFWTEMFTRWILV